MIHARARRTTLAVLAATLGCGAAYAEVEDNAVLPTSFLPGYVGAVADLLSIGIDIRIKYLPPSFIAPEPEPLYPNADLNRDLESSLPQCLYLEENVQIAADYDNILGVLDIKQLPEDWGPLGMPIAGHNNAPVNVEVASPFIERPEDEPDPICPQNDREENFGTLAFPSGTHRLSWSATTQLDPLFDIVIPFALFPISPELKYKEILATSDPGTIKRAAKIGKEVLGSIAEEIGLIAVGSCSPIGVDTASHVQRRDLVVYDVNEPVVTTTNPLPAPFEAVDFGGIRFDRVRDELRELVDAFDRCGAPFSFGEDAPFLLPVNTDPDQGEAGGRTAITWTARDLGPLPPDMSNDGVASVTQYIRVEDTLAPILLAPPNRVVEADSPAETPRDFDVGTAVVFDLADPEVLIENTVPVEFPVNSRTAITWTATDDSGNQALKTQWVTVKAPGTNTPPMVDDAMASTLTSEPVDLTLTGSDGDFLDGSFDPLNFDIVAQPANGFFVAPLVPYFIEDYRVRPGGTVGDIINFSNNPAGDLGNQFCRDRIEIPVDFVYRPLFVQNLDDGRSFVLDEYWDCSGDTATTAPRISRWSATGEYEAQIDARGVQNFTIGRDGLLYVVTLSRSPDRLSLTQYGQDFTELDRFRLDTPPSNTRLLDARIDTTTGIIYATDRRRLHAYDAQNEDSSGLADYLGALLDNEQFLGGQSVAGSSSQGYQVEVDSEGFSYVVGSTFDRIHQFGPSMRDSLGVTLGEYIGWLGRCDSGPNCDEEQGRSIGYSCTDDTTCLVSDTAGSGPGQFDTPIGIALDPEDTLYVTDYDNFRVQRFTPLGDFAGEAKSECDGTCFVLGDMGRPVDVSVNSSQFFVLDRDRALMHVFETAPFKEITENSVVVTYASDNDFQGTDTFTFRAGDGLAFSPVGTATIEVARAFRAPEALGQAADVAEEQELAIVLEGDDPDGIAGVDFNGLDTLTFEIVEGPSNGMLSGTPPMVTYTPNAEYSGPDSFTFRVSDGVFDSEPAAVELTVTPVNDVPVPRFTARESKIAPAALQRLLAAKAVGVDLEAGLGFPVPLFVEFDDPDVERNHFATIDWGDGSSDSIGTSAPPPDASGPGQEPVITDTFDGIGQLVGEHVYLAAGDYTVDVCIFDTIGSFNCIDAEVSVVPMVDLVVSDATVPPAMLPVAGATVPLQLEVLNSAPDDSVSGETATNVVLTGTLPADVVLGDLDTDTGSCGVMDRTITCNLGSLPAGTIARIDLLLATEVAFDADAQRLSFDVTADQTDASPPNAVEIDVPVRGQTIFDAGGFETDDL